MTHKNKIISYALILGFILLLTPVMTLSNIADAAGGGGAGGGGGLSEMGVVVSGGGGVITYNKFSARIDAPDPNALKIYTAQDLHDIRNNLSGSYVLMNDIDLSQFQNGEWTPIGKYDMSTGGDTYDMCFKGVFDGQGHVIRNLKISGRRKSSGLFAASFGAVIKNVGMENTMLNINQDTLNGAGALCGWIGDGSVSNCYNTGVVSIITSSSTIAAGQKETLVAAVLPVNATYKTVEWHSNNKKIADVSNKGVITAISAGKAKITAVAEGGVKASCTITVTRGKCGDDLFWDFNYDDALLKITGTGDMWDWQRYGDDSWFGIHDLGLYANTIDIAEGVTSIGGLAFYGIGRYAANLILPDSLLSIGNYAFSGALNLSHVNIPKNVIRIGEWAFDCTHMQAATFEGNAPAMGDRAFPSDPYFKIYYNEDSAGFTTPTWHGYTTEMIPASTLIPKPAGGGGNGAGGGGGSSSAPIPSPIPTPVPSPDVVVAPRITPAKPQPIGNITLNIDNSLIATNKTIRRNELDSLIEKSEALILNNGLFEIALSPDTLKSFANLLDGIDDILELVIKPSSSITVPVKLLADNKSNKSLLRHAVDISMNVNGKEINRFDAPVMIKFDISALGFKQIQKTRLTAIKILKNGAFEQIGGDISDDGKFLFAYASTPSQYSIIISETLVKIVTVIDKKEFFVNGKAKTTDAAPILYNGRTMVLIRFIAEALGADVGWDGDSSTVTVSLDGKTLTIAIDQPLSGMDIAPFLREGRTMVPLRYISESLNANVLWDGNERKVTIYR